MNSHKGFTLIELLLVTAIIATLSTVMTVSMAGSTARAKTTIIASNVHACIEAAAMYIANHEPYECTDKTADDVLKGYMPKWADYRKAPNTDAIRYTALVEDKDKGSDNWAVIVDFSNDPDKVHIKNTLQKIKGYSQYYDNDGNLQDIMGDGKYSFKVMLNSGRLLPDDT